MPQHLFATAGLAYISAMVLSIEALKYVNFPTKELGKSCKVETPKKNSLVARSPHLPLSEADFCVVSGEIGKYARKILYTTHLLTH